MNRFFADKKIFLIGGPGGVGKTTLAATTGVRLAEAGYRTLVLTVDPARRLAQALGFTSFEEEVQRVQLKGAKGELWASMLDTQRYLDRIVEKFATSETQKKKILANPLYRAMVDNLGGTTEYAAMERLLEFVKDTRFEKIVVDTPPTQNAIELLSAPQRLADFMDNSVLRWFQGSKPLYFRLFQRGTKLAMKAFQIIFGSEFLERLGELMTDLEGMQSGFRQRHLEVLSLLKSEATAFFLVTYPTEPRYLETLAFLKSLKDQAVPLAGLILNRVEPAVPAHVPREVEISVEDRARLNALISYFHSLYASQDLWVEKFAAATPTLPRWVIPRQHAPLHDVAQLSQLGRYLVSL